jgi:two-component system sensor histidine kinase/response regulator
LGKPSLSENALPCVNQDQLAELRALSKARDRDLLGDLTRTFFSVVPDRITAICAAAAARDGHALAAGAHQLKGGAACIGADRLAALCGRIESIGDADSIAGVETLIEQLKREVENVREAYADKTAG